MTMDMDEVRQRQRPAVDLIRKLAQTSDGLSELVDEHVADNDEILSTLVLSDIARWYSESYTEQRSDPARYADAQAVVDRLGEAYEESEGDLWNTIAVGLIEALIPGDNSLPDFFDRLPESLRQEMIEMINWKRG
jgi:hypothetical protein